VLLAGLAGALHAHEFDDLYVCTNIRPEADTVLFDLDIAAGPMLCSIYLGILDPDQNRIFEEEHIRNFAEFLRVNLTVAYDGHSVSLALHSWEMPPFEEIIAGFLIMKLTFSAPLIIAEDEDLVLSYKTNVEAAFAIYYLKITEIEDSGITVTELERSEFFQNEISLLLERETAPILPLTLVEGEPEKAEEWSVLLRPLPDQPQERVEKQYILGRVKRFFDDIDEGRSAPKAGVLLMFFAMVAGFLHAFTPGHGKALVGAYMAANQGTVFHAVFVGLIVTFAHTVSICTLASTATYFFLPAKVFPVMSALACVLFVFLGLRGLIWRLFGRDIDHAHLLANLQVLRRNEVNIVIENGSEDALELLHNESEDDELDYRIQAAGAEQFRVC
jgi:hypothetical protein